MNNIKILRDSNLILSQFLDSSWIFHGLVCKVFIIRYLVERGVTSKKVIKSTKILKVKYHITMLMNCVPLI